MLCLALGHLPSVFHVTVPRHQVIEAQDALLMLEPVSPQPLKAVLRHAMTNESFHEIELWKIVSIGHRLDVPQLWIETLPAAAKARDNTMITVLCSDVLHVSEALRQGVTPHLMADERLQEETNNQLVTYRKCWVRPDSETGEKCVLFCFLDGRYASSENATRFASLITLS